MFHTLLWFVVNTFNTIFFCKKNLAGWIQKLKKSSQQTFQQHKLHNTSDKGIIHPTNRNTDCKENEEKRLFILSRLCIIQTGTNILKRRYFSNFRHTNILVCWTFKNSKMVMFFCSNAGTGQRLSLKNTSSWWKSWLKVRSHCTITTLIPLVPTCELYRTQYKYSHFAAATTSTAPIQPIVGKNKSHSQISQCEQALKL